MILIYKYLMEMQGTTTNILGQINKFTALAHHPFLQFNWQKMNLLSLLSATLATLQRPVLAVVELSLEDVDNVVPELIPEAVVDNSKESAAAVASKVITNMIVEEDAEVRGVEEGLVGRTTTSHNETVMHLSISSPTGRCWRRSISIVWLS